MKPKIIIFGKTGMAGAYCHKHFDSVGYNVKGLGRNDFNPIDKTSSAVESFLSLMPENSVVLNCLGVIKPRVEEVGILATLQTNSIFPRLLANVCEKLKFKMIHLSSDCKFSGQKIGVLNEITSPDAKDIYGVSKWLGEPENCTVVTTSIIGESANGRSLVEWLKSNRGGKVSGIDSHYWNGVTCLEFAKVCQQIIEKNLWWNGVRHIHTKHTLSKFTLLQMLNSVYNLNIEIEKVDAEYVNRALSSKYETGVKVQDMKTQLEQMRDFGPILHAEKPAAKPDLYMCENVV